MLKNTADFEISTLIYILLAIVAFVSSIFQKKKQQAQDAAPENKKTDWKDLFDDFEPEPVKEVYEEPVSEKKTETFKPQPVFLSTEEQNFRAKSMESYQMNEESFHNSQLSSYEYEDVIKMSEIKGEKQSISKPLFEMDLEKAIIYSEIIQRKY